MSFCGHAQIRPVNQAAHKVTVIQTSKNESNSWGCKGYAPSNAAEMLPMVMDIFNLFHSDSCVREHRPKR